MPRTKWLQSHLLVWALLLGVFAIVISSAIAAFRHSTGTDPGASAIRESAYWPAWLYCGGSLLAVCCRRGQMGNGADTGVGWARLIYTAGCAALLLHIAIAFHAGHGWSHAHAYRHVEAMSGFGPGLYVNYAFALIWSADVAWSWVNFECYRRRPRWLSWSVLLFLDFIVFNAAVVFGSGVNRIVAAILLVIPIHAIWATRPWAQLSPQKHEPGQRPGSDSDTPSVVDHSPT